MQLVIAEKIATYLAEIAATARTKRALDRFLEKKALTLADLQAQVQANPMGYGAGLGALGGGLVGGGSTALANLFREKADRKSVLNNALLGGIGGGALGLAGGSVYSAINEPETQSKGNVSTADRDKLLEKAKGGALAVENVRRAKQIADLEIRAKTDSSVKGQLDKLKDIQKANLELEQLNKDIARADTSVTSDLTGGLIGPTEGKVLASAGFGVAGHEIGRGIADRDLMRAAARDPSNNKDFHKEFKRQMGPEDYKHQARRDDHLKQTMRQETKGYTGYRAQNQDVINPSYRAAGTPKPNTKVDLTVRPSALRETLGAKQRTGILGSGKAKAGLVGGLVLPWLLDAGASYMGINPETNRQDAAATARTKAFDVADRLSALGVK